MDAIKPLILNRFNGTEVLADLTLEYVKYDKEDLIETAIEDRSDRAKTPARKPR